MTGNGIGRRVVIRGNTGSGKSTLGKMLADRLRLPFVELDALFWEPEWTPAPVEVFHRRIAEATAGDAWLVAGNYRLHSERLIWPRTQTMVWLDYGLPLLLRRLIVRSWRRYRADELLWGTNRERFWHHFYSRESLLLYAITAHRRKRRQLGEQIRDPRWSHIAFVRLRSPRETERWLAKTAPPAPLAAEPALDGDVA